MAENQDDSEKTEEPSQKKLDEAHKKGEVAKSQEVRHWFVLLAVAMAIMISGQDILSGFKMMFRDILEQSYSYNLEDGQLLSLAGELVRNSADILMLPALILVIGALTGAVIQHKPIFTLDRIKPELKKISLIAGFKRLFSAQNFVEFLKSISKFIVVGAVVFILEWPERGRLPDLVAYTMSDIVDLSITLTLRVLGGVLVVMAFIAGIDYVFQRMNFIKKMRMSKQEIKDEYKQTEGDPFIKGKLRQIRMERSRRRMMAAVPEADVVITNPTHYSIALRYEPTEMEAPVVLAKGVDEVAARIREIAKENNIPLIENPPLARALFATVEIDEAVPPEHYRAVAEVISYIMKLKKGKIMEWRR